MKIIALHGKAGAGKDTLADRLVDRHGFVKRGFADPLYEEVARAYGVTVDWLRDRSRKELPQPELALLQCHDVNFGAVVSDGFRKLGDPRSPRWVLEQWGTNYRRAQSVTYWLDRMGDYIVTLNNTVAGVVIPDCRFANEARWVYRQLGAVVEVVRPGLADVTSHVSAIRLPDELIERTITNAGTISYLHAVADSLIRGESRIGRMA